MTDISLKVSGMACEGCVEAVRRVLGNLDPRAQIRVDLASGDVFVSGTSLDLSAVEQAVEKAGYEVRR